jgi:hypothetical protein
MTEQQARTAANTVLVAAAVGAAFVVLRSPSLRRVTWQLARAWVTGPLVVWAGQEIRRAWEASAPQAG